MERIKNFFVWGGVAFILAFVLFIIIGGLVHLCYPQYTLTNVVNGALGCGIGMSLVSGVRVACLMD